MLFRSMAVMVLALYIDSPNSRALYHQPDLLWAAAPVLLLWIMRVWLKTGRRELHGEDPLAFALKDPFSWATLAVMIGIGPASLQQFGDFCDALGGDHVGHGLTQPTLASQHAQLRPHHGHICDAIFGINQQSDVRCLVDQLQNTSRFERRQFHEMALLFF